MTLLDKLNEIVDIAYNGRYIKHPKQDEELDLMIENYAKELAQSLKALEIIKENLVVGYDESENDKPCLALGVKVDKDKMVIIYLTFDKEKIDLLKEVLL